MLTISLESRIQTRNLGPPTERRRYFRVAEISRSRPLHLKAHSCLMQLTMNAQRLRPKAEPPEQILEFRFIVETVVPGVYVEKNHLAQALVRGLLQ